MNLFEKIINRIYLSCETVLHRQEGYKMVNEQMISYKRVVEIINQVETEYTVPCTMCDKVDVNTGWIFCEERLPENWGWYWGYVVNTLNGNERVDKVLWKDSGPKKARWYRQGHNCEVVAWMPLPEPPEKYKLKLKEK